VCSPEDDRFWAAALDLDMPLTAHTHMGHRYPTVLAQSPPPPFAVPAEQLVVRQAMIPPMMSVAQLIETGVFDRFPKLQLYFAETQASWLPCALYQMDENADMFSDILNWGNRKPPSEYFREHIYLGIIRDPACARMPEVLPLDRLMWGTDFPHGIGAYPDTASWLERNFSPLSPSMRRKILLENPAAYFRLDLNSEISATPA
jgi:predicted TIM-barrel fold metal-dependent hydrolase